MYQPGGIRTLKKLSEAQQKIYQAKDKLTVDLPEESSSSDVSSDEQQQDEELPQDAASQANDQEQLQREAAAAQSSGNLSEEAGSQKKTMAQTSSGSFSNKQLSETTAEERMNQTAQSFNSCQNTSRLGEGGAQIRNLTMTAEQRQQAIKETLLMKQQQQREQLQAIESAAGQDEEPVEKALSEAAQSEVSESVMDRNTRDADFAQRMIEMRQREQDGMEPMEDFHVDLPTEDEDEKKVEEDDEPASKNFMTRLYEDETFCKEKALIEEQLMEATQATMESKGFIKEMDEFLKDLESWKQKRQMNQDAATQEELKAEIANDTNLTRLEEQFMKEAEEREQQILEKLKAINIDPSLREDELGAAMPQASDQVERNTDYLQIMEQIEQKERLLAEKEQEFKEEAYEEIKLSEENQKQVDARKKELEALLANMQQLESEFDDLDAAYDDQLDALLKPDLTGFEKPISQARKSVIPEEDSDDDE